MRKTKMEERLKRLEDKVEKKVKEPSTYTTKEISEVEKLQDKVRIISISGKGPDGKKNYVFACKPSEVKKLI